jgi:DNA polymerase-3 subunit epsilon
VLSPETPLTDTRFVVFDTETTGLEPGHVLQLAFVVVRGNGEMLEDYSTYVKRRFWRPGPLGAHHVHGITRRHLRSGVPMREALDQLEQACAGAIPVAHNAAFDLTFLRAESQRLGRPLRLEPTLCSLKLSRSLDPQRSRRHKLANLVEHYGLDAIPTHDALADAKATALLLPHLIRDRGASRLGDIDAYRE